jgi:hypothetical protein
MTAQEGEFQIKKRFHGSRSPRCDSRFATSNALNKNLAAILKIAGLTNALIKTSGNCPERWPAALERRALAIPGFSKAQEVEARDEDVPHL